MKNAVISPPKKLQILEKIYILRDLNIILDVLFSEIHTIFPVNIKGAYLQNSSNRLKLHRLSLPDEFSKLKKVYEKMEIKVEEFPFLNRCISENLILRFPSEEQNEDISPLQKRFQFLQFHKEDKDMILIPFSSPGENPIGVLILNHPGSFIPDKAIRDIEKLIHLFYHPLQNGIIHENFKENQLFMTRIKGRYHSLIRLSSRLNQLFIPDQVFKLFIEELIREFHFELGFIQMKKKNSLPIVAGAALNRKAETILEKEIEYFSYSKNAPKLHTSSGPEMACCSFFLNNIHYYVYDVESLAPNVELNPKDQKALELAAKPVKSFIQMPIRDKGKPVGMLQLWSFDRKIPLSDVEIDMISSLCSFIPSVLRNARLHDQVERHRARLEEKNKIIHQKNSLIKQELELARDIQMRLLPANYPENPGTEFAHLYKPMEEIGGDYFDFISFPDSSKIGIFISDVSGHGVPAALITSMVKTLLDTSGPSRLSPSELLSYINKKLFNRIHDNFLTAFYGIYDPDASLFTYSKASHTAPLIIRGNEIIPLESPGKPLAILEDAAFLEKTVSLCRGDKILFYTDGLTEAMNSEGREFEEKLPSLIKALSVQPVSSFITALYHELLSFHEDYQFEDDVCLVGMEILI
jgi:serine phosphatase RsbU (regulator of sigma subunit)